MCRSNVDQVLGRFRGDQIVRNLGILATLGIKQCKIGPKLATFWLFLFNIFLYIFSFATLWFVEGFKSGLMLIFGSFKLNFDVDIKSQKAKLAHHQFGYFFQKLGDFFLMDWSPWFVSSPFRQPYRFSMIWKGSTLPFTTLILLEGVEARIGFLCVEGKVSSGKQWSSICQVDETAQHL
jgi:hypothetical protein